MGTAFSNHLNYLITPTITEEYTQPFLICREPVNQTKKKLCVFVSFQMSIHPPERVLHLLRALIQAGYTIFFVTTNMYLNTETLTMCKWRYHHHCYNENPTNLLWDTFRRAIRKPFIHLKEYDWVLLCTDSKIGPIHGQPTFETLLTKMHDSETDYWKLIDQDDTFVEFSRNITASPMFPKFAESVHETNLPTALIKHGFCGSVAYNPRQSYSDNPYETDWPNLLCRRFPFLPIETMESEPSWWELLGNESCFDRSLVKDLETSKKTSKQTSKKNFKKASTQDPDPFVNTK